MGRREELLRAEAEGWEELHALVERLPDHELERPDYNAEGWSAKDMLWHVAFWCADTAAAFGRMRDGTFDRASEPDGAGEVDPINDVELRRSRAMALEPVREAVRGSRAAMLDAFGTLGELTPDAVEWFEETGALHYAGHLPELRALAERPQP